MVCDSVQHNKDNTVLYHTEEAAPVIHRTKRFKTHTETKKCVQSGDAPFSHDSNTDRNEKKKRAQMNNTMKPAEKLNKTS